MSCKMVPKEICYKCKKGIFNRVISIPDEGKTPIWDDFDKKWLNEKYYHPECAPIVIDMNTLEMV